MKLSFWPFCKRFHQKSSLGKLNNGTQECKCLIKLSFSNLVSKIKMLQCVVARSDLPLVYSLLAKLLYLGISVTRLGDLLDN